jgi:hypothetical protein
MIVIGLAAHTAGVHCSACQAIISTRHIQLRTVGEVLCRPCLAARPDAPFALRLRSHRLAAGLSRSEVQAAAGLAVGCLKNLEDRGAKPQALTRARPWHVRLRLGNVALANTHIGLAVWAC